MDASRTIEGRVSTLERQMELVLLRVAAVERRSSGEAFTPAPPPVLEPATYRFPGVQVAEPAPTSPPAPAPEAPAPVAAPTPPRAPALTEYQLGAKVLPRLGAAMVLLAGLIFVSWGISTGAITAQMQFAGELVACLAFLAVGQWKRAEKEEFGEILTGIGACLLYFSFAGAHVFKRGPGGGELITGETLVASFMVLSFLNLLYARARSSKAFFVLGLTGGVLGSLLPLDQGRNVVHAALHLSIIAGSLVVAIDRKWSGAAVWTWIVGFAFVLPSSPAAGSAEPWWPVYAVSLMGGLALMRTGERAEWDPRGQFVPLMAVLTALAGMGLPHWLEVRDGLHVAGFGVAFALLSLAAKESWLRERAWIGGAVAATVVAPMTLSPEAAAWAFLALAGVSVAVGAATQKAGIAKLGVVQLAFASLAWAPWVVRDAAAPGMEAGWLVGAIAVTLGLGHAFRRSGNDGEWIAFGVGAAILPFLGRLGVVGLGASAVSLPWEISLSLTLLPYAALASGWAASVSDRRLCGLATGIWLGGLLVLAATLVSGIDSRGLEASVLIVALVSSVGYGLGAARLADEVGRFQTASYVLVAAAPFVARLAVVVLGGPGLEVPPLVASGLGLFLLAVGTAIWSERRRAPSLSAVSSLVAGAGLVFVWLTWVNVPLPRLRYELPLLAAGVASVVLVGWAMSSANDGRRARTHSAVVAAVVTVLVARLAYRFAGIPSVALPPEIFVAASLALSAAAIGLAGSNERRGAWAVVSGLALLAAFTYHVVLAISIDLYELSKWSTALTWRREVVLVGAIAAGVAGFAVAIRRLERGPGRDTLLALVAIGATFLGVRLSLAILGTGAGLEGAPSASIGLTLAATLLLIGGFVAGERMLRWSALAIFLTTVAKVLVFDLQAASFGLRVGAFLALGLAMLGGGYAYIRARERLEGEKR